MADAILSRQNIAAQVAAQITSGALTRVSKADLFRRFDGQGASRATIYRAVDDAIAAAAAQGVTVEIEQPPNQWAQPKPARPTPPPEAITQAPPAKATQASAGDAPLDPSEVRTAIANVGKAISGAAMRDHRTFIDGVAGIRTSIARLRQAAGDGPAADRIIASLIAVLQDDPSATVRLAHTLLGG